MSKVQYLIEADTLGPDNPRHWRYPLALDTLGHAKRLIEDCVPETYVTHPEARPRRFRIIETLTFSVIYEKDFPDENMGLTP